MIERHVLDNLLEGVQVIDTDFRYVYVNAAAAAQGRTTIERLLGRTMMEAYPGIETTAMFGVLRRCLEERSPQVMENEFTFPDGSKGWFELRFEPVPEGVAILSVDISGRKQAEAAARRHGRALAVLSACNQTLVRATDERRFMDAVCRLIVERGGYRLAWIGMKEDGTERTVRPVARAGADDGYVDQARVTWDDSERGAGLIGRAIRTGQPVVARFIATDPEFVPWREAALARGFASAIALPIRDDGEVLGALAIYAAEPDAFDEAERELLAELALDLGYGLTTLRGRLARERAEARWSLTFDAITDAVCVLSPGHEFLAVNRAVCNMMKLPREQIIGRRCFELVHRTDAPIAACPCTVMRESGRPGVTEHEQDGRVYELSAWPLLGPDGTLDAFVHVVKDITDRRQAEAEVRRSRDTQQVIASILRLALENRPLEQLLPEILRRVLSVSWLNIERRGAIFLVENEPGVLALKASEGLPAALHERCGRVPFGTCLCGRAASANELAYACEVDSRHEIAYQGMAPHGHYCVPISVAGEVLGVLNTYLGPGHARSSEEVGFLTDVATAIAGIIVHRRAEEAQQRANEHLKLVQRLEAVGRLAGGVAHDFNNLLSVIISYAGFAAEALGESDPVREDVVEIQTAAQRAAALTRQLLAFSRKQILQPEVLNLNQVVSGIEKMLRRLLGEDVDIDVHLAEDLGSILADSSQVEQVIVNLAVNARDAMPTGGKLTIETANVELDADYAGAHIAVKPGRYVMLSVSDTGTGMDEETRKHIFEPFFTTKEKGKGTGLGLSTVYGIVKQSGGSIWVYSEPGRGSTFKVYLPRVDAPAMELVRRPVSEMPTGSETVLVVEDEAAVRKLAERILRRAGYKVLSAAGGGDALLLCERHQGAIDLLVTDVVMPQMSGRELAERLAKICPRLKVLYMSGYTDNAIVHHGVLDPGTRFIGKPFAAAELTRKVREVIDEAKEAGG